MLMRNRKENVRSVPSRGEGSRGTFPGPGEIAVHFNI